MITMALMVESVGSAWMSSSNFGVGSGRLKACSAAMIGLSSIILKVRFKTVSDATSDANVLRPRFPSSPPNVCTNNPHHRREVHGTVNKCIHSALR